MMVNYRQLWYRDGIGRDENQIKMWVKHCRFMTMAGFRAHLF